MNRRMKRRTARLTTMNAAAYLETHSLADTLRIAAAFAEVNAVNEGSSTDTRETETVPPSTKRGVHG